MTDGIITTYKKQSRRYELHPSCSRWPVVVRSDHQHGSTGSSSSLQQASPIGSMPVQMKSRLGWPATLKCHGRPGIGTSCLKSIDIAAISAMSSRVKNQKHQYPCRCPRCLSLLLVGEERIKLEWTASPRLGLVVDYWWFVVGVVHPMAHTDHVIGIQPNYNIDIRLRKPISQH